MIRHTIDPRSRRPQSSWRQALFPLLAVLCGACGSEEPSLEEAREGTTHVVAAMGLISTMGFLEAGSPYDYTYDCQPGSARAVGEDEPSELGRVKLSTVTFESCHFGDYVFSGGSDRRQRNAVPQLTGRSRRWNPTGQRVLLRR